MTRSEDLKAGGPRRRCASLARSGEALSLALALLLTVSAHAGWRVTSVPGTPRSVEVWRPDVFSVATSTQASLFVGTAAAQTIPGASAGTFVTPANCLLSLQRTTASLTSSGCQAAYSPLSLTPVERMRHTSSGGGYAAASAGPEVEYVYDPAGALAARPWGALSVASDQPTAALGVVQHGGQDHALFGARTRLLWFTGSTASGTFPLPSNAPANDLQLLDTGATAPLALLASKAGLFRALLDAPPFAPVPLPGGDAEVLGVHVSNSAASPFAAGFGMGVLRRAGVISLIRAVPVADGGQLGTSWSASAPLPAFFQGAPLQSVSCLDSRFCVVSVNRADTDNLFLYANDAFPSLSLPAALEVRGGEAYETVLAATDSDGDPLALRAESAELTVTIQPDASALRIETVRACEDRTASLTVRASDGWAAHDVSATVAVKVLANRLPVAVVPDATAQLTAQCGAPAEGTLRQSAAPDGCPVVVSWSQVSGPPLEQASLTGSVVTLRTAGTGFADVGKDVVLQVRAEGDPGNVSSAEQRVRITAEPFVSMAHSLELPAAFEGGLAGVSVTFMNTTACPVDSLTLTESLEGLAYVEGSARLDGEPLDVEVAPGTLHFSGLSLLPGASLRLTYVARPLLGGRPSVRGEVRLRSVRVSGIEDGAGPAVGCGCSSAPSPFDVLWVLATVTWWSSRGRLGWTRARRVR